MGNVTNALIVFGIWIILMVLFIFVGGLWLEDPSNLFLLFVFMGLMFLFVISFLLIGMAFARITPKRR